MLLSMLFKKSGSNARFHFWHAHFVVGNNVTVDSLYEMIQAISDFAFNRFRTYVRRISGLHYDFCVEL